MKSTAVFESTASYIGADLTDRYAKKPRPIDVCGLWPIDHGVFELAFWTWQWSHAEPLVAGDAEAEIKATRCSMLDAPQALALAGRKERACERVCRAPGKTPDHFPALDRPFGGFVRSSVEFFDALHRSGIAISPPGFVGGACEYYPGDAWPRLAGRRLPNKSTPEGRRVRRVLLSTLGVRRLPDLPTHDQSDACMGAILAAAADGQIRGLTVVGLGDPLATAADGGLREGPIATPYSDDEVTHHLIGAATSANLSSSPQDSAPRQRSGWARNAKPTVPALPDAAEALFQELLQRAADDRPAICTYAHAYRRIFRGQPSPWSPAYARKVIGAAAATTPAYLRGLGRVKLDAFIVSASTRRPGSGHWNTAGYGPNDWERILGNAELLR